MSRTALVALVVSAGCGQVFGLESPARQLDAGGVSDDALDASSVDPDAAPDPHVRAVTVVADKVNGGPHTDFPVAFASTETWLRSNAHGGDVGREDGFDIYFSADQAGTTRLAHEVERYEPATGTLVAWVKVPSLTSSTVFYIHYGDTSIVTSLENRPAVWSNDFAFVAHFTGAQDDSTANGATFTETNVGSTGGHLASASLFDGTTSTLSAGSDAAIDDIFTGGGTVEAWIRPTTFGENERGRIVEKQGAGGWVFYVDDLNVANTMTFLQDAGTDGIWVAPANAITLDQWQYVVVDFNKDTTTNNPTFYVNGVVANDTQTQPISGSFESDAASLLHIGNNTAGDRTFTGGIDEVRLSSSSRAAGWITTTYANQASPSTFYTVGAEL